MNGEDAVAIPETIAGRISTPVPLPSLKWWIVGSVQSDSYFFQDFFLQAFTKKPAPYITSVHYLVVMHIPRHFISLLFIQLYCS